VFVQLWWIAAVLVTGSPRPVTPTAPARIDRTVMVEGRTSGMREHDARWVRIGH
jgi:hypothetical protein